MAEIASAFVTLLPSAKGFGSKLGSQINGDVTRAGKTSGGRFGKVFATASMSPLRAFGAAAVGLFAVDKVKDFFASSIGEAREAQKVGALTAQVIKTTGGAANISAKQIGNLATAISNKTGIDDEAIQSGENLLLTFTGIRNEVGKGNKIFNQATQIVTDMSASLGQDMKSSAVQVGKALNDPIKGVTALQRVGVTFTQKQKDQIKSLVDSGKSLDAQKLILRELNKEFGGSAAAQATAGEKMSVAWGNLKEQIGTALLPVLDKVQSFITSKIIPAISTFITQIQNGTGAGGRFRDAVVGIVTAAGPLITQAIALGTALAQNVVPMVSAVAGFMVRWQQVLIPLAAGIVAMIAAFKIWTAVTKAYIAVQTVLNFVMSANPLGAVILLVIGLAAALVVAYKRSSTFRAIVQNAFAAVRSAAGAVVGFFTNQIPAAFNAVKSAASNALGWVRSHWPTIVAVLAGPIGIAVALVVKNWDRITAGARAMVSGVKSAFGRVISIVSGLPGKIVGALGNLGGLLVSSGEALISGFARGITAKANDAYNAAKGMLSKITNLFPHSPAKEGPFSGRGWVLYSGHALSEGLAKGIRDKAPKAVKAAFNLVGRIKSQIDTLMESFGSLRDSIASTFTGGLFDVADAVTSTTSVFAQSVTAGATSMAKTFVSNLLAKRGELTKLVAAFKKLVSFGLSPAFLSQLFQSGNGALILDLAAGPASQARLASTTFGQIQGLAQQLGTQVATDVYGPQIVRRLDGLTKAVQDLPKGIRRELNGTAKNSRRR